MITGWSAVALFASCSGGGPSGVPSVAGGGGAQLLQIQYGRLVDVYAYRRVDLSKADRRDTLNRAPVKIATNLVVDSTIQTQALFDAVGGENVGANYRYLPFDVSVGHEELLILWDDRVAGEKERFDTALDRAQRSLVDVPAAYRGQLSPVPVVPRNAAMKLTFSSVLAVTEGFFRANPSALQLLEFRGDPNALPVTQAFNPLPVRIIPDGKSLIVDPSLIGSESRVVTTAGMPPSRTSTTANIRLAIPTRGQISPLFNISADPGVDAQRPG